MKYVYCLLVISCKKENLEAVSFPEIENISVQENLKNLYPEIGYTPDISFSAKQNFINNQKLFDGTGVHCFLAGTKIKMANFQ